jgi:predicted small lipoprotein YifL
MFKNRIFSLFAALALVSFAACGADDDVDLDDGMETTTTEMITEQDTTLVPVVAPVVTEDTGLVQTTIETDVDVDVDTIAQP